MKSSSWQEKMSLCSETTKEEFVRQCRRFGCGKTEQLFLLVLCKLGNAISEGNLDIFKKMSNFLDYLHDIEDQIILKGFYDNAADNDIRTDFVILACKHNSDQILTYIFDIDSKILKNLSISIRSTILPANTDETSHNAFYYAIRSGNIKLLELLINKWPDNYFSLHSKELEEILSQAYEKLKLKKILMSDEVEYFVGSKLINLRFFSSSDQNQIVSSNVNHIKDRIQLVIENINFLVVKYSNRREIDEQFLFIAKFIAKNIHILKRQFKSTYDKLPWEEMEFCLISFIACHIKQKEINIFCHTILNKSKILNHLKIFANKLVVGTDVEGCVNIAELKNFRALEREEVVIGIINNCPQFEELYKDYQKIRDIHSLQKINDSIKLALSANPRNREGHLIIIRVLQVIGEHLKNTMESPKLSSTASELLLLSLPRNTRKIIMGIRNSLSHAYSLSKRSKIEKKTDCNFFVDIQNDVKKIGRVINDILYNYKIESIRIILRKLISSETPDEIKENLETFGQVEYEIDHSAKSIPMEQEKLEKLIEKLSNSITEKTNHEQGLFKKIRNIISGVQKKSENISFDYVMAVIMLKTTNYVMINNKTESTTVRVIKFVAEAVLNMISSPQMEPHKFKQVAQLSKNILHSVRSRIWGDKLEEVIKLIFEILYTIEIETGNIKQIEELKDQLREKDSSSQLYKENKINKTTKVEYNDLLALKICELRDFLKNNSFGDNLSQYKNNAKIQAVVEMLVLDIMSILGLWKTSLENNVLFLDEDVPLLIGTCLRNHLAHDNTLIDVLSFDPSIAILLNAEKISSEHIMREMKKKIGKLVPDDTSKLKDKYLENLDAITNQEKMFVALEEGNFDALKIYLRNGADINARSIKLWTALHFAAKGSSVEVMRFLLDQNLKINMKNINGQNSLHIAAAHGRQTIVKFLIEELSLFVDEVDNAGRTPLHHAAQNGHKNIVEILLTNKSNAAKQDMYGLSPLHYSIKNNHVNVAKVILEKDINVDINETLGGYTPLHLAIESGNLEIVNFLLQSKADVNARNDNNWTPLHEAVFNGHLEVVLALILKGADVDARVIDGCSPLHFAVENGQKNIVKVLLEHGASVNVVNKTQNNTPLHFAAKYGHKEIVEDLIKNGANSSITTITHSTPLHLASQSGHFDVVRILLKQGVSINAKDIRNATPLFGASQCGHKGVVELLIKHGAEVDFKTNENLTPLHVAALNGHTDIIDFLIRNKAKVNVEDSQGETPLHAAAMNGKNAIIDFLIENKAEVNTRTNNGMTPLHAATSNGHIDTLTVLISNKANVNAKTNEGLTPLHIAILQGHNDIVNLLIKNHAEVNVNTEFIKPLHLAVEAGKKEIVEVLLANGANVNYKCENLTPLSFAIKCNYKEIVEVLIANGAIINDEKVNHLALAVLAGHRDVVELLLKNDADIHIKSTNQITLLHFAAQLGYKDVASTLIKWGADINAVTMENLTAMHIAAKEGFEEIVEILIANGANVDAKCSDGVPMHLAAGKGHDRVVKVLLNNKANINVKDDENRTCLELAVGHGHLQIVEMLLQYTKADINAKGNDDWTLLHIASQESNMEVVRCLVNAGYDIYATNLLGSMPIHIAAREGFKDAVAFFLEKGMRINEVNANKQTLLHYAAMKGHLEVVTFLIAQGADINAKDVKSLTPMHIAAVCGCKDVIDVLLKHGAVYNNVDNNFKRPIDITLNKDIIKLLTSIGKLFEAVKRNIPSEVESSIKSGAFINTKNTNNATPLIHAAWKGLDEIVDILLKNKANPNIFGNKGFTPLHYAVRFSHIKVVKYLLSNGAVYNAVTDSGKTPIHFSVDTSITELLKLIDKSFKKVKDGNYEVIKDLNKIKAIDTLKAIMNARNVENKTLIVFAMQNNFSKVQHLKEISQGNVSAQINIALQLCIECNFQGALNIFRKALEKRIEILGHDNPGTLDLQTQIADVLYIKGVYDEALRMLEEIVQRQKEILGLDHENTLNTKSRIALVLHSLGKNEEALNIFQEVFEKQRKILGANHSDTLDTQFHMALVLDKLGRHEEALSVNRAFFQIRKIQLGANDLSCIHAQNNIAMVLTNQGKFEEALEIYKEVLESKKKIFGINHFDTLRTLSNIASVFVVQNKYYEALKAYEEVLNIQKNVLGPNNPDTLHTQYSIGHIFFSQCKWIGALKVFTGCFTQLQACFGKDHPYVLDVANKMEIIKNSFKYQCTSTSEVLQHLQKDINIAANEGDIQYVKRLLENGADINDGDIDGRTPLHYAINNEHVDIVKLLLNNGADITRATNKGNTPLHTATSRGYKEIVEMLLQHACSNELNDFINSKTTSSGASSLHVAVKNNFFDIAKSLLKRGAIYDIKNKEGKRPIDLSNNQNVANFLKLIDELFIKVKRGRVEILYTIRTLKQDEFVAATNARNSYGHTLLQVALANRHQNIASELLKMLKQH